MAPCEAFGQSFQAFALTLVGFCWKFQKKTTSGRTRVQRNRDVFSFLKIPIGALFALEIFPKNTNTT
ncbi:MAG: hypothetical protein EAX86_08250 [Candidatus Heimdallarchaeota archaeon]|nr:hypothetical protein [Candidatus Heimdallarchaeota archaeon]